MLGVVDFGQHELQYLDSIPISKTSPVSAHGPHFVFNVHLLYSCGTCTQLCPHSYSSDLSTLFGCALTTHLQIGLTGTIGRSL